MESLLPEAPRVLIVSDTGRPQLNGVVRTIASLAAEIQTIGGSVSVIGPYRFRTIAYPPYPEVRLALFPRRRMARLIDRVRPDALHIMTEGPLGFAASAIARERGWSYTTTYATRFPEYVWTSLRFPKRITYAYLRNFHNAGSGVMVSTRSLREELESRGFTNVKQWSRGVDVHLFTPDSPDPWSGLKRPVFLYVGRVAPEKNIEGFLDLDLPGSKVVVGDGPLLSRLRRRYPGVHFDGPRSGAALGRAYAGADVFVFPSQTDTFGLVLLESLACGTPVAAFPVTGPKDVLAGGGPAIGAVDGDLRRAALAALEHGDRTACRAFAERFSWRICAEQFLANLVPLKGIPPAMQAASPELTLA